MSVIGKYVSTFAGATHAMPQGMHMNADYPLMLPPIVSSGMASVTLRGRDGEVSAKILKRNGEEYCVISQSSTFEKLYRKPPQRFVFHPFKDENTPLRTSEGRLF